MRLPRKSVFSLAALGVVLGGVFYMTRSESVAVVVQEVGYGPVQSTVANTRAGTVNACRRARISPAAGGQVARVAVREGVRVKAEQVLLELWNEDVEAQLDLARQESIAAQARAEDVCVRAEDAAREARRLGQLHERGLASDERRDQANTEAKAKDAACRAARANLLVSEAQIAVSRASIDKTILRAPFDGIVAEVYPEVGEYMTPSPPGIATPPAVDLIDDSCVYVTAPIDEVDAAAIRTGMAAVITLDALRDRSFRGKVRRIAPYVVDVLKQARTVDVEVVFDDAEETKQLLIGYSADTEIILERKPRVLRVPSEAVLEGNRVLLLDPAREELTERTFQPGLFNWRFTEVESGLDEGDLLVTSLEREGVENGARAVRDSASP